jgi:hypothetical protein
MHSESDHEHATWIEQLDRVLDEAQAKFQRKVLDQL